MSDSQPEPLLVTVEGAAHMLGVSRSKMFKLLHDGDVSSVLLSKQIRRVPVAAIREYVEKLLAAGPGDSDAA